MADTTLTIQFRAQIAEVKKALADIEKLAKQTNEKARAEQRKTWTQEAKHARFAHMHRAKFRKLELREDTKQFRLQETQRKLETSHLARVARHRANERRREVDHIKQYGIPMRGVGRGGYGGGGAPPTVSISAGDREDRRRKRDDTGRTDLVKAGLMGAVGGAAVALLLKSAGAAVGLVSSAMFKGYQRFVDFHENAAGAIGLTRGPLLDLAERTGGSNLGYNIPQIGGLISPVAHAFGEATAENIRTVLESTRAYGLEPGEAIEAAHTLRTAGMRGREKQELTKIFAAGTQLGLEKGLGPEFAMSIIRLVQMVQQQQGGAVGPGGITQLMALGRMFGGPGMQAPARAADQISQLHQGIISPGGGEEGMNLIRRAYGYGVPGGIGFLQAERMRQRGLGGADAVPRFMQIMDQLRIESGGVRDEMAWKLSQIANITMDQADNLFRMAEGARQHPEQLKELEKALQDPKSMKDKAQEEMAKAASELAKTAPLIDQSIKDQKDLFKTIADVEKEWADATRRLTESIAPAIKFLPDLVSGISKVSTAITNLTTELVKFNMTPMWNIGKGLFNLFGSSTPAPQSAAPAAPSVSFPFQTQAFDIAGTPGGSGVPTMGQVVPFPGGAPQPPIKAEGVQFPSNDDLASFKNSPLGRDIATLRDQAGQEQEDQAALYAKSLTSLLEQDVYSPAGQKRFAAGEPVVIDENTAKRLLAEAAPTSTAADTARRLGTDPVVEKLGTLIFYVQQLTTKDQNVKVNLTYHPIEQRTPVVRTEPTGARKQRS